MTRGYNNLEDYKKLIKRNKHIEKYYNKEVDYIIFHEGNIYKKHQEYIQNKTNIPLIFRDVSKSFKTTKVNFYPPTNKFKMGYRNMCNFWFCDFWNYVKHYDKLIRIDEDCYYHNDYNKIFELLDHKVAVYPKWVNDVDFVTKGLYSFTNNFLKNYGINKKIRKIPSGPYTNVIGFNLNLCRQNDLLFKYIAKIKKSNNIYIYRWGDLPLWGNALTYLFDSNSHMSNKNIKYFHGSHNSKIN